jgi:hypothetical protein
MHRSAGVLRELRYGFDVDHLYLRLEFTGTPPFGTDLELEIRGDAILKFRLPGPGSGLGVLNTASEDGTPGAEIPGSRAAGGRIVEMAIPLEAAGLAPREAGGLRIRLRQSGEILESIPAEDDLGFVVPGIEDEGAFWSA